jgi:aspartyl-tRNA(Asn)/glutamyl-tRNA(Gln) amidotransferase subunit C
LAIAVPSKLADGPFQAGATARGGGRGGVAHRAVVPSQYDVEVAQPISKQDVAHVARLARLALCEEELELYTTQLASVLGHARDIEALDIADVPPTAHPFPLSNVLREDEPRPCLDRDEVLAAAPEVESGRFRIPRILSEAP